MFRNLIFSAIAALVAIAPCSLCHAQLFDEPVEDPVIEPEVETGESFESAPFEAAKTQPGVLGFNRGSAPPVSPVNPNAFGLRNGLTLAPMNGVISSGLEVIAVQPFSVAESSGLEVGDILVSLSGSPVNDEAELIAVLASLPPNTLAVGMEVLDVKTGSTVNGRYFFRSFSGVYQSNLGRVELKQKGDEIKAKLVSYKNFEASMVGRLIGNTVSGTWKDAKAGGAFRLNIKPTGAGSKSIFEGNLTSNSGRNMEMIVLPLN